MSRLRQKRMSPIERYFRVGQNLEYKAKVAVRDAGILAAQRKGETI